MVCVTKAGGEETMATHVYQVRTEKKSAARACLNFPTKTQQ